MIKILGGIIASSAALFALPADAQVRSGNSSKAAVVVDLEAPKFEDASKGRVSESPTYFQRGNNRNSNKRQSDAKKFCNRINYSSGLALAYGTVQTENVQYDYLKRVVCFE